jgi:hypothetical protein
LRYLQGIFAKDAPLSFPYSDRYVSRQLNALQAVY